MTRLQQIEEKAHDIIKNSTVTGFKQLVEMANYGYALKLVEILNAWQFVEEWTAIGEMPKDHPLRKMRRALENDDE